MIDGNLIDEVESFSYTRLAASKHRTDIERQNIMGRIVLRDAIAQ